MENIFTVFEVNNRRSNDRITVNSCGISWGEMNGTGAAERPNGREDYQVFILLRGTFHFIIGDAEHLLTAGQFILIPPRRPQKYYPENAEYECRWIHFSGRSCEAFLSRLHLPQEEPLSFPADTPEVRRITGDMVNEYRQNKPFCEDILLGQFTALLGLLARLANVPDLQGRGTWQPRLEEIRKEIYWTYRYDIHFDRLAQRCGLSYSRFEHLFKKQYGVSPHRYQTVLRMEYAKNLLQSTDLSIRQVAERAGYADQNYFSRLFKQYTGKRPGDYQK